jgi:hypothetical protein
MSNRWTRFLVTACALLCWTTTAGADDTVVKWTPEQAMLNKLGDPQPCGRYMLRTPRGYTLQTTPGPDGSVGYAWATKPRHDSTRAYILVFVGTNAANDSLSDLLDAFIAGVRERRNDVKESTVETGTINDLTFARAYWAGIEPTLGVKMHGFVYVAQDGPTILEISSQDVEPYSKASLRLAEASALTFRKQPLL